MKFLLLFTLVIHSIYSQAQSDPTSANQWQACYEDLFELAYTATLEQDSDLEKLLQIYNGEPSFKLILNQLLLIQSFKIFKEGSFQNLETLSAIKNGQMRAMKNFQDRISRLQDQDQEIIEVGGWFEKWINKVRMEGKEESMKKTKLRKETVGLFNSKMEALASLYDYLRRTDQISYSLKLYQNTYPSRNQIDGIELKIQPLSCPFPRN